MDAAESILRHSRTKPVAEDLRTRLFELGEALYQSVRMQMSVEKYYGLPGRSNTLDSIDVPLNNSPWLIHRFAQIRSLKDEKSRLEELKAIVDWKNPGPGGFYDNPGSLFEQGRLRWGRGFAADPEMFHSTLIGTGAPADDTGSPLPVTWRSAAQALYEAPLVMEYERLDPSARYRLRVAYTFERNDRRTRVKLEADGVSIHPYIETPPAVFEFEIPQAVTADGRLTLTWTQPAYTDGSIVRGCNVAEVWLMKVR